MLIELNVINLAIIESLHIEFGQGLNILTGETGAGKSIIIDAVNLLLGERASTDVIRSGCEDAAVEGLFEVPQAIQTILRAELPDYDLFEEGNDLILRREIGHNRRSVSRINGRAVPVTVLHAVGQHLIDIHGQGDHLSLLQVRRHVDFLDQFGGLGEQRQAVAALVARLRGVRQELGSLQRDERELARRIDLLTYQSREISDAFLAPGEDEALAQERQLLGNAEKRAQLSASVYERLVEGDDGQESAIDWLGSAVELLSELAGLDPQVERYRVATEEALYQLEDVARALRIYRDDVEFDPDRLAEIEERLDLIYGLKLKYGESIAEILAYQKRVTEELEGITHAEDRQKALQLEEKSLLDEIGARAGALSKARLEASSELALRVEAELAQLNMAEARFLVDLTQEEDDAGVPVGDRCYAYGSTGLDRVEFLIAPNLGEEPKPLVKIASGGETSRLMLAMKNVLSDVDQVPTLIFDEIDSGIGGRTGDIVGKKLSAVAHEHQVFCITHLAQMACYAERHFRVSKQVVSGRTVSIVQQLALEDRIDEIAVMLGGAVSEATRHSARELLQRAVS